VARNRLLFGTARCGGHAEVAFLCGIVPLRGSYPPSRRRPRGGAGLVEVVDVG
jgi:hypothetical protein